jgi:6-phosphogluconolactonase
MVSVRPLRFLRPLLAAAALAGAAGPSRLVYIGTYTGHGGQGIYAYRFDPAAGALTDLGLAARSENPSFLATDPAGTHLYAVNENARGAVSAFRIDGRGGRLIPLNQVLSGGAGPCALAVNRTGHFLFVANYSSGSVALVPVQPDGSLSRASAVDRHRGSSIDRQRQQGPHAHSAAFSPDDRFALSADLGTDRIYIYRFEAARGRLVFAGYGPVEPGAGPRHLVFHPNGRFAYVIDELTDSVTQFLWKDGALTPNGTVSALPPGYTGPKSGAEIQVDPSGRFLYASSRGDANDIAIFAIDAATGRLAPLGHVSSGGRTPRHFAIDPTGRCLFAANQDSNNIAVFRIDPLTGALTSTGESIAVPAPACVQFVPAE